MRNKHIRMRETNEYVWQLTSQTNTLTCISSSLWARLLLNTQKCTTTLTGMSQTHGSGDPSPHSWVTDDVVYGSKFTSDMWPDFGPSFSTSMWISLLLYLFYDDRLPYGESLPRNTDALLEYCFSLLPFPFFGSVFPSLSCLPQCTAIPLPLQPNLSLCTLQTGDACALMTLSKEEVQD